MAFSESEKIDAHNIYVSILKDNKWSKPLMLGPKINTEYDINNNIKELPMCKCGVPCDIKKNDDKNYLFFRCAKKNMWENFKDVFDIEYEPCNFFI